MPSILSTAWSTVKGRIIALVLVSVMLPLAGGSFYVARLAQQRMEETSTRVVDLVDARIVNERRLLEKVRDLQAILAMVPSIRHATKDAPDACLRLLAGIPRLNPWTTGVQILGPDGDTICDSSGLRRTLHLGDRPYVQRAIAEKAFVLSDFIIGRQSGEPLLVAIDPLIENGQVVRLISIGIALRNFGRNGDEGPPFEGRELILDRMGKILVNRPDIEKRAGQLATDMPLFQRMLAGPDGVIEDVGVDGVRRLWGFRRYDDGRIMAVALPMDPITAEWWGILWRGALGVALIGVVRIVVLLGLLHISVLKWLKRLNLGVERVARGERDTGVDSSRAPREIGTVLDAFNLMAARISERERELTAARDEADRANRVKSDFLATMSHELRTPMNGLIGFAELLLETPLDDEPRGFAMNIRDAARHLLTVLNDVLDYSRLEAGLYDLKPAPLRVESLVSSCVALMRPLAEAKRLHLDAVIDEDAAGMVLGDADRLRQVLFNLLSNALKFTDRGRVSIAVSVRTDANGRLIHRFAVSDTGIGIEPERQAELFRKFVKLIHNRPGTGLGLAICQKIVTAMDGAIGVTSTPGMGSTFWFTAVLPPAPEDTAIEPAIAVSTGRGARILLVDDVAMNRDIAVEFLRKGGHRVDAVDSGARAVERAGAAVYDLILMDVYMPGMDGMEATQAIRTLPPPMGTVPVVAMTAGTGSQEIERCLAAGMNGWIGKPVDRRRLLAEIERWADPQARHLETRHSELLDAMGPEGMADLLDSFIEEVEERVPMPEASFDSTRWGSDADSMAAAAADLGFAELAECGRDLVESCRCGDKAAAQAALVPLRLAAERALAVARSRRDRFRLVGPSVPPAS